MTYVRFTKNHDETCQFELFEGFERVLCGAEAVGYRGRDKVYLCQEHFDWGRKIDNVHESDVKWEKA